MQINNMKFAFLFVTLPLAAGSPLGISNTNGLRGSAVDQSTERDLMINWRNFAKETLRATLSVYPGYTGDRTVSGEIVVRFNDDDSLLMKMIAEGLTADCSNCGVHIHEGTTCDDASMVRGHYWNTVSSSEDMWTTDGGAVYHTDSSGVTESSFVLNSGYDFSQNVGHAAVVHDSDGTRIACGVLRRDWLDDSRSLKARIRAYPGQVSGVRGWVLVDFFPDETFRFSFFLNGVESGCTDCGIHIHEGTTCDDASLVLGHYWNTKYLPMDPWVAATGAVYNTGNSETMSTGTFYLNEGYGFLENVDHAVVVHRADGSRAGCGVLKGFAF